MGRTSTVYRTGTVGNVVCVLLLAGTSCVAREDRVNTVAHARATPPGMRLWVVPESLDDPHCLLPREYAFCCNQPTLRRPLVAHGEHQALLTAFQLGGVLGDTGWFENEEVVPLVADHPVLLPRGGRPLFQQFRDASTARQRFDHTGFVTLADRGEVVDTTRQRTGRILQIRTYHPGYREKEGRPDLDNFEYEGTWCVVKEEKRYSLALVDAVIE